MQPCLNRTTQPSVALQGSKETEDAAAETCQSQSLASIGTGRRNAKHRVDAPAQNSPLEHEYIATQTLHDPHTNDAISDLTDDGHSFLPGISTSS